MPVVSEYTRKLKEGIDIYKKRSSKPKRESRDLGALGNDQSAYDRLQMYLPQNLKLPGNMKFPGYPPERQSLAPHGPKQNYVKDYSDYKGAQNNSGDAQ